MDNESFEVNLIEGLASEHEMEIEYESDKEFELESDDSTLIRLLSLLWSGPLIPPLFFPYTKNSL